MGGGESVIKTNGGFLISQIKQIGGRIFDRMLEEKNIDEFNGAQGRILYILWQKNPVPIVELSKKTSLAPTTLTSMLDRMEQADLILRMADPHDRRKIQIALTEKAYARKVEYDELSDHMSEIYYQGFTEEEIRQFEEYLSRVLENLTTEEKEFQKGV